MDVVECLPGVLQPDLVHEIRCPVRPDRPGRYRNMLQQANLELQLLVGIDKFPSPLCDPSIEFAGDPLLFA